jgi:hypothetical protein
VPVSDVKLSFRIRRNSPPSLIAWFPRRYVAVSEKTKLVSVRPCGKFDGPPKFRPGPTIVICGMPMAVVTPSLIP